MYTVLDKLAYLYMSQMVKKRPVDINVETITLCPLKCKFCCNRLYEREYTVMNNELFEKIVREYSEWGGAIGLSSMQSDFFLDPLLMERLEIINKYKRRLWIYGTTTLISCKKYSDAELLRIVQVFDYLGVSALGWDKKSYQDMANIDGFDILREQLRRVQKLILDNGLRTKIVVGFRTNNKAALRGSVFYKEIKDMFVINEIKDTFFSWFGSIKQEDLPKGAKLYIRNNCKQRENCVAPATLAVQANGKVIGCGCIDWLEKYVIGNTNTNTLKEIWQSVKAKKFRYAFQRGKIPTICKECGLYTSVQEAWSRAEMMGYRPMDGLYYRVK